MSEVSGYTTGMIMLVNHRTRVFKLSKFDCYINPQHFRISSSADSQNVRSKRLKFSSRSRQSPSTWKKTEVAEGASAATFSRHFPPPSLPRLTTSSLTPSSSSISPQRKFQACYPVLPHESLIISELATPPQAISSDHHDNTSRSSSSGSGCHGNTPLDTDIYFDNYVDFFKGCLNETDVSLSNYTTDEVWNLIKLESPFDDTSCTVYYGGSTWSYGNTGSTTASCY